MDESKSTSSQEDGLLEPIMDASFLDDEINTVNDEFSSWKLTIHNNSYPRPFGVLHEDMGTNCNNSANNNTLLLDLSHQGETIASMTGSILEQLDDLDFEEEESCNLFSAHGSIVETLSSSNESMLPGEKKGPPPTTTGTTGGGFIGPGSILFSTDSLDRSSLLLSKLQRMNHQDNYTIAFQSSAIKCRPTNYKSILTQSCPNKWVQKSGASSASGSSTAANMIMKDSTITTTGGESYLANNDSNNNKKVAEIMTQTKEIQTSGCNKILICYPNYVLPDLKFLKERDEVLHKQSRFKSTSSSSRPRPLSCNDVEMLKRRNFSHVKDWESLNFLLPREFQELKPISEREKNDPNEKEVDEQQEECTKQGALQDDQNWDKNSEKNSKKLQSQSQEQVVMRRNRQRSQQQQDKLKRFSLQEIQEITEMTNNIKELLDNNQIEEFKQVPFNTPNNKSLNISNNFLDGKTCLTNGVALAVDELTKKKLSKIQSNSPHGKLVLETLCPALYSLLSDGLAPFLDTIFGRVPNTVWRVVEASIQCGPTAQSLSELVLRINSEEMIAEGPVKFNAFICGLLNLRSLTSWLTFLRTKDRLLRSHYDSSGLMYSCNTSTRSLYDQMLATTLILSKLNYSLDIFHETKLLHQKFSKHAKYYVNSSKKSMMKRSFSDERPKKRSPAVSSQLPKSKTQHNISRGQQQILQTQQQQLEEKQQDKFKKLQLQWELLTSDEKKSKVTSPTSSTGSKIPRPISAIAAIAAAAAAAAANNAASAGSNNSSNASSSPYYSTASSNPSSAAAASRHHHHQNVVHHHQKKS